MPKLLSRSKQEEFLVELSIAYQKPEGKKSRKCMEIGAIGNLAGLRNFRNLQNFVGCEFSQPTKLPHVATVHQFCHYSSCTFEFPLPVCPF